MKNTVDAIIQAFSKEEFREFKYFLNRRNSHIHEREDIKVLSLIRSGENIAPENIPAYRQTKNRIKMQLEFFVEFENIKRDAVSQIQNLVEVAKYLFHKNLYNHAWDYLNKAEKLAIEQDEYALLDHIYHIQISYSYSVAVPPSKALPVPMLLKKRNSNLSFAKTDGNANAAYALLIYEIRRLFSKRLYADIEKIVSKILNEYELNDLGHEKIRIYCKIVTIVCRALREKRDYQNMKIYGIKGYELIKSKKMLNKIPLDYLMDLLDGICVAALRSKDYENCEKYQTIYSNYAYQLKAHPDEYSYYDFIPFVDSSDLYMCTNRLGEARKKMLTAYAKYKDYGGSIRIYFLLRANLLAIHFSSKEYSICVKLYHDIMNQDKNKILSEPGFRLDLIIYTELYGAIFYYENDDADHAWYLLNAIKRKYAETLMKADSKREQLFIKIMGKIINEAAYMNSKQYLSDYKKFIRMKTFIPGDNEYISLNAWLTSKFTGKSYYECFLSLVK